MKKHSLKNELIKNAGYNFIRTLINRLGGLIFTIVLARLLLPELFGIFSILFSIVTIIVTIADFGTNNTLIRYASYYLGKNKENQIRDYFKLFLKIKLTIIIIFSILLGLFAKTMSTFFFDNDKIFYLILISIAYIIILPLENFFESFFYINKDIKSSINTELILQISRIIFAIVAIHALLDINKIAGIFIGLILSGILALSYVSYYIYKKCKYLFNKEIIKNKINKKKTFKFLLYMALSTIPPILFGNIDIIMLGKFVSPENVGYYRVALSIILTIVSLFTIIGVTLPAFTQLQGKKLKLAFSKIIRYTSIITIPAAIGIIFIAKPTVSFIFGYNYINAVFPIYFLAITIIIWSLNWIYIILFQAKEKANISAKKTMITLITNIILNYILIKILLEYSELHAISGAAISTSVAQIILFAMLSYKSNKVFKIGNIKEVLKIFIKPIVASAVMIIGLIIYTTLIPNITILKILVILIGIIIYFIALMIIKGISKEDITTLKTLVR